MKRLFSIVAILGLVSLTVSSARGEERVRVALSVRNVVFLPFYCPILGGLKPSPLGDSFSTLSWQYDNVWG